MQGLELVFGKPVAGFMAEYWMYFLLIPVVLIMLWSQSGRTASDGASGGDDGYDGDGGDGGDGGGGD